PGQGSLATVQPGGGGRVRLVPAGLGSPPVPAAEHRLPPGAGAGAGGAVGCLARRVPVPGRRGLRPHRPTGSGNAPAGLAGQRQAITAGPLRLRVGAADDAVQGGDVASVGGPAGRGEAEPDPLPGVADGAALGEVAGVGERGQVLAEGGLADVEQGQQGAELDLPDRVQGRADPQPYRGVDQLIEAVRDGRLGGLSDVLRGGHRRAARALSVSPVPANRTNSSTAAATGGQDANFDAIAPASITSAAGPYSTIRSRCLAAPPAQPSQTPRARPAASAMMTSAAATGTVAASARQPDSPMVRDRPPRAAPVAGQYHAGYPRHATRLRLSRTDASAADASSRVTGSLVSMMETLWFPRWKRKRRRFGWIKDTRWHGMLRPWEILAGGARRCQGWSSPRCR